MFTLSEQLFLLAVDDFHGIIPSSIDEGLQYGLAGGILADLVILSRLAGKEKRLVVIDPTPIGNELLDEALRTIATAKKPHQAGQWINALATKKLNTHIAEHLASKNILHTEEKRYIWVVPFPTDPQPNASAKYWLKQRLRAVILAGEEPQLADVALLGLLKAGDLLKMIFTKDERKWAQKRVNALVFDSAFTPEIASILANIYTALEVGVSSLVNGK